MKSVFAFFIWLLGIAALAQGNSEKANEMPQIGAPATAPKADDDVPAGGCMPIGMTAKGELVFPMLCRTLLEQQRGSSTEPQSNGSEQRPQTPPLVQSTPMLKQQGTAPEEFRGRARDKKISIARQRKKQPAGQQVDPEFTGSTEPPKKGEKGDSSPPVEPKDTGLQNSPVALPSAPRAQEPSAEQPRRSRDKTRSPSRQRSQKDVPQQADPEATKENPLEVESDETGTIKNRGPAPSSNSWFGR